VKPQIAKLITEPEVADFISVSSRTIRRYRKQGILPFYQIGKKVVRYDKDQCVQALNEFRVGKDPK
jgi:predicted site-specific integrase-resolvase